MANVAQTNGFSNWHRSLYEMLVAAVGTAHAATLITVDERGRYAHFSGAIWTASQSYTMVLTAEEPQGRPVRLADIADLQIATLGEVAA